MSRGRHSEVIITLTPQDRTWLQQLQRSTSRIPAVVSRRARLILCRADGMTITDVAARVGISRRHTYKWLERWLLEGRAALTRTQRRKGTYAPSR